mmetsp:Transcript_126791/g.358725  ORF Transcript_126791/g.358725 Transcript_126791/m.358725 type:complete len:231 (+) Transcript_126791:138-830(+)
MLLDYQAEQRRPAPGSGDARGGPLRPAYCLRGADELLEGRRADVVSLYALWSTAAGRPRVVAATCVAVAAGRAPRRQRRHVFRGVLLTAELLAHVLEPGHHALRRGGPPTRGGTTGTLLVHNALPNVLHIGAIFRRARPGAAVHRGHLAPRQAPRGGYARARPRCHPRTDHRARGVWALRQGEERRGADRLSGVSSQGFRFRRFEDDVILFPPLRVECLHVGHELFNVDH